MATTSIPKERLVQFIIEDINASSEVRKHFGIGEGSRVPQRLLSITKPRLVAFVHQLGDSAVEKLARLGTQFPMYRPPTLYLAVIDRTYQANALMRKSRELAIKGRDGLQDADSSDVIRCLHTSDQARRELLADGRAMEISIQYERRIDVVSSEQDSEEYGTLVSVYSLETAFIWLPLTAGHQHGVIACCDFPAVRQILGYLGRYYDLRLTLPNLDSVTLEELASGATPRSVTYRRLQDNTDPNEIQTVTLADPALSLKKPFLDATQDISREQTAGFYTNHPDMADGGLGVSRRDGKVWTPKRLDRIALANLALGLIRKTEKQLAQLVERRDIQGLIEHYFGSSAEIDERVLKGKQLELWRELAAKLVEASENAGTESRISLDMLTRLAKNAKSLDLTVSAQHECPSCNIQELSRCPHCQNPLTVEYRGDQPMLSCPTCHHKDVTALECDCGTPIEWADLNSAIRLAPLPGLLRSITRVFEKLGRPEFGGVFIVLGTRIKVIPPVSTSIRVMQVDELGNWHRNISLGRVARLGEHQTRKLIRLLNKTKEKCKRGWTVPKKEDCRVCNEQPLPVDWIESGQVCLARVLGHVIGQKFDGIHHGREIADLKYQDQIGRSGQMVRVGIHLKSRVPQPPPEGMGRSKDPIKGLYTQLIFSAYLVAERGQAFDVLGIGIPNKLHSDAQQSLEFAATRLGFSFVAVQEREWLAVWDRALETASFDTKVKDLKEKVPN